MKENEIASRLHVASVGIALWGLVMAFALDATVTMFVITGVVLLLAFSLLVVGPRVYRGDQSKLIMGLFSVARG